MKFLPFENITYETSLDQNEVYQRLDEVIEPSTVFRKATIFGSTNDKPYEGSFSGNTFKIIRIIGYRNSFLPRIKGTIETSYNGTKVNVKMRLHPFVIVFMLVWFGLTGVGCFAALANIFGNESFDSMNMRPFGMLIFGYALVTLGFKYESIKSKKFFAQLFEVKLEK